MNKVKVIKKMGLTQIVIKSLKGQQLSEHELYSINNNEVRGLLHLDVMQKGTSFKLTYNVTGFISFREYLANPFTKDSFARMLQNILANLKAMKKMYFHQENVLMDFNRVMVNPATQNIYFIYVPIPGFESGNSLREFLINIIQFCSFAPDEDNSYVRDYILILNNGINFSEFELEEYIKKLLGEKTQDKSQVICPSCHSVMAKGIKYCSACGARVSGNTGGTGNDTYNFFEDYDKEDERSNEKKLSEERIHSTQELSDSTTVLGEGPGGTVVLGSEELDTPNYPYLIREKNREKIMVNKSSFRIGKEEKNNDYFVSDNNAVSRRHADIITKGKRYFIVDLNSTNKTYLDGRAIPVEKEVEVYNGTKLRLANEDFIFYIEG